LEETTCNTRDSRAKILVMRILVSFAILLLFTDQALAWNALGHKVVCEIAWQQLSDDQRKEIVEVLKRHPRFAEDFMPEMPSEDQDHWIFLHAGTWPDIARGIRGPDRDKFDKPIWHYVNFPLTLDGFPEPKLNLGSDPAKHKSISWNVLQATNYCLSIVNSDAPPQQQALAYSWLFHLLGDMHQPMHSTALFCERFPKGDRGGNSIKLVKGDNLHSLWDNLLGRSHKPNDVKRVAAELKKNKHPWIMKTSGTVDDWIQDSHAVAEAFAYNLALLNQISDANNPGPFTLPPEYYFEAGNIAQGAVIIAGLRLSVLLGADPHGIGHTRDAESFEDFAVSPDPLLPRSEETPIQRFKPDAGEQPQLTHWLNTKSNVRHNSSCDHFQKTKNGRPSRADEGNPCGICGG
jgi:hypothetical protein